MNLWKEDRPSRPNVITVRNLVIAFVIHTLFFLLLLAYACLNRRDDEKPTDPIDLTVVVVENLDGNEDEPPPLKKPEPPPPPPPPKPKPKPETKPKEPEKPKELEKIVTNIVTKVEKKEEKKQPKKPEKTREQLMKERRERALQSVKTVKTRTVVTPQPNGRTDRKALSDAEIQKLLNMGYKPGKTTQLAASEEQRCISLIRMAFEQKWDKPAWTDTLQDMYLRIKFGPGGKILNYKLVKSSTDGAADQSILDAARRVYAVSGLSAEFLKKNDDGVTVRFKVTPQ